MSTAPPALARDPARGRDTGFLTRRLPIGTGALLVAVILGGLLLREFIVIVEVPLAGYRIDLGDFTIWAQRLASVGPGAFYAQAGLSDYPPGYMYVLWLLGFIGHLFAPVAGMDITAGLVKIPALVADAGGALLLFALTQRVLSSRAGNASAERLGLVAAAVYMFNPGVVFDSAVWGQVDSVGTLVLLATIYCLVRGWTEAAAAGAVLALLVKFQFAFIIPIVLVVGLKRHLAGRSTDPDQDGRPDLLRVLTSLAAGLGTTVLLIIPFGLSIWSPGSTTGSLVGKFIEAAATYPGLTVNAFNLWMNPFSGLASGLPGQWGYDTTVIATIGSFAITWQTVGLVLFVAVAAVGLWAVWRRDDPLGILVASLVLAVAFFALPTRVHERYLFPALALAAPLVVRNRRWMVVYILISGVFFANVYGIYTADWSYYTAAVLNPGAGGLPMARESLLNATLLSPAGIYLLSALIVVILGWLVVEATRLAGIRLPAPTEWPIYASTAPEPSSWAPPAVSSGTSRTEPEARRGGWRAWLRRAPEDRYYRERWRRLDRVDLVLVVAFVVFAFVFRLWRLDVPPSACCFDEIYHARSATEWLADWEHGWKRDVYEWTHPMMAKYLIAAGIEIADPNKVVERVPLDTPVTALAVAPRRASLGYPRSIAFIGAGDEVVARDALSGEVVAHWNAGGPVGSLAYDETDERLLVGLTSTGRVDGYDLHAFLRASGARGPPSGAAAIDTGLRSVTQILVPADASIIAVRGDGGIAVLERTTGAPLADSTAVVGGIAYAGATGADSGQGAAIIATDTAGQRVVALDAKTLKERQAVALPSAPIGPVAVVESGADQKAWVPVADLPADTEHGATIGGMAIYAVPSLTQVATVPMPGRPAQVIWQRVADMVYVAGTAQADGAPQVWTVNPLGDSRSGFAAFDTTALTAPAAQMAVDASDHAQGDNDSRLLVATAGQDGSALVGIDAGSTVFAWRLMGIVFGAGLVGLIYLLAATMFRRRGIAILAAAFVALDGMSYVMSRIAMNDIYVAVFIVAAYLAFYQVWSGRWPRSSWWVLPLVGVLIGLAAATKWVGIYALAGLWVLVLGRSALGRFLLVAGAGFLAVVAGLGAPWPFAVVMVAGLGLAMLLVYARPVRLAPGDLMALPASGVVLGGVGLAFAIAYGQVAGYTPNGLVELVFTFLARGAQAAWPAWIMLAVSGVLIAWRAAVSLRDPRSDRRWYQPGELAGFAWPWVAACLLVLPLVVYFLSYVPYLQLGHTAGIPDVGPGYAWSLDQLQAQMFGYHFGLTAGHPAASPWWSWPLDLKTVWFFGGNYDDRAVASVYNGGNPILFWAGVPAVAACGFLAWRRRSPGLALLVAAFAFQFLPWTRIERATFEYHYFTAVLFAMVAVAYIVDEALRNVEYQSLAIAFLVAAAVVGILIFPLGSALPMPDWYINAARSLPPWNYAFTFPNPAAGIREPLVSANNAKLAAGVVVSLAAAAFALFGRDWLTARPLPVPSGAGPHRGDQEEQPEQDDRHGPDLVDVQPGDVVADQEPRAHQDKQRPEDDRAAT